MPNWCCNVLAVFGPGADAFRIENTGPSQSEWCNGQLTFEKVAPAGEDDDDWYAKHCTLWGTKSDACDVAVTVSSERRLCYKFKTAYTPPTPWLVAASEKYPALRFVMSSEELSMTYRAMKVVKGGAVIEDTGGDYGFTSPNNYPATVEDTRQLLRADPTLFSRETAITANELFDEFDADTPYCISQVTILNRLLLGRRRIVAFLIACMRVKRFARLYVIPHFRFKPGQSGFKRAREEFEGAKETTALNKSPK